MFSRNLLVFLAITQCSYPKLELYDPSKGLGVYVSGRVLASHVYGFQPSTSELVPDSCFAKQWTSLPSAQEKYFYCSISDSNCLLLRLSVLLSGSDTRAETVLN